MNDTNIIMDDINWTNHQEQEYEIDIIDTFTEIVRYLYSFQSKVFISYFSRHRSDVSFSDYDNIEEHMDLQNQP